MAMGDNTGMPASGADLLGDTPKRESLEIEPRSKLFVPSGRHGTLGVRANDVLWLLWFPVPRTPKEPWNISPFWGGF